MTTDARALPPGTLVTVADAGDERLGVATFNPHSLICARLISRDWQTTVDTALFKARLSAAADLRHRLFGTPHYRLAHSEADSLPGPDRGSLRRHLFHTGEHGGHGPPDPAGG